MERLISHAIAPVIAAILVLNAPSHATVGGNASNAENSEPSIVAVIEPSMTATPVEYGIRYSFAGTSLMREKSVRSNEFTRTRINESYFEASSTQTRKMTISAGLTWPSKDGVFSFGHSFSADDEARRFMRRQTTDQYQQVQRDFTEFFAEDQHTISYGPDSGFARSEIYFVNNFEREIIIRNVGISLVQLSSDGSTVQRVLVNGCLRVDNGSVAADSGKRSECDAEKNRVIRIPPIASQPTERIEAIYFEGLRTDVLASLPVGSTLELRVTHYDLSFADTPDQNISWSDIRSDRFRNSVELVIAGSSNFDQRTYVTPGLGRDALTIKELFDVLGIELELSEDEEGSYISRIGPDESEFVFRSIEDISDLSPDARTWIAAVKGGAGDYGLGEPVARGTSLFLAYLSRQDIENSRWHIRRSSQELRAEPREEATDDNLRYCVGSLFINDEVVIEVALAETMTEEERLAVTRENFREYRPRLRTAEGFFNPESYGISERRHRHVWRTVTKDEIKPRLSWTAADFEDIKARTEAFLNGQDVCEDRQNPTRMMCRFILAEEAYGSAGGRVCMTIARSRSSVEVGRAGTFPQSVGELAHLNAIKGWGNWVAEDPLRRKTFWEGFHARIRAEVRRPL